MEYLETIDYQEEDEENSASLSEYDIVETPRGKILRSPLRFRTF